MMRFQWMVLLCCLLSPAIFAADADSNVALVTQNPLARNPYTKYYAFPFSEYFDGGNPAGGGNQSIFYAKPLLPFQITENYDLILRTITPLVAHQPAMHSQGAITGWGDLNPTFFISPTRYRRFIIGLGPTLSMPTATNAAFGSGKWSAGPELALFVMPDPWVFGILTSNIWSFAGDTNRPTVNQLSFQYFISYNFPRGWYVTSQPTLTANWKAPGNQVWTVPVGIGGGKAFSLQNAGMGLSLQGYYNVIRPAHQGPNWQIQAKIEYDIAAQKVTPG